MNAIIRSAEGMSLHDLLATIQRDVAVERIKAMVHLSKAERHRRINELYKSQ